MVRFRLHKNVVIELPRIENYETLESAKKLCQGLDLPQIKIEVVPDIEKHPLYIGDAKFGFYLPLNLIPRHYPINKGSELIVIQENETEFLYTLFHELGHAVEPPYISEDASEIWAWSFAFFVFRKAGFVQEAEECWNMVIGSEEDLR